MKMSEIKVGEEYALGLGDWDRRHPKRVRVLETNAEFQARDSNRVKNNGVKIAYLDSKGEVSQVVDMKHWLGYGEDNPIIDHIESVVPAAIMQPWDEWVKEAREDRKAQKKAQEIRDRKNKALDARLQKIRDKLPESEAFQSVEAIRWKNEYRNEVLIDLEALEALVGLS